MKSTALGLLTALLALVINFDAEAQLFRRPQPVQNNNSKVRIIGRNNTVTVQQSNALNGAALSPAGIQRLQAGRAHAYTNQQLLVSQDYRGSLNAVNTFTTPVNTAANIRYIHGGTQAIVSNPCPVPVVPATTAAIATTVGQTNYIQVAQPPAPVMQQLQQAYVAAPPAQIQVVVPPQVQQEVVTVPAPVPQPQQVVIQPQVQYQEVQQAYTAVQPQVAQVHQLQQEVQYVQQPQRVVQREVSYQQQHVAYVHTQHARYECAPQHVVAQRRQFVQHCAPKAGHYRKRG